MPCALDSTGTLTHLSPRPPQVRAQGVKLLLLTNSHFDYTQFLMTYAFGSDWKALFDLSIVYAQKPGPWAA